MNGPTRKKLYEIIAQRDGEYCRGCCLLAKEKQLVVDHRDNNNKNNNLDNLQLLCRSCNYLKNPRPLDLSVSECAAGASSAEIQINRKKEPLFRKYVAHQINERCQVPIDDLINSGSEINEISPVTAKRYLMKMCSNAGIYQLKQIGNTIILEFKSDLKHV